ncbi:class F sortase [Streptomyces sp. JJ36]|uniref:class F sortase n=1 Tax=Streptomyces sp. JJ36 TaxID=2736645 RepID=UPI001F24504A|nr:class F sortase [Streptomyces sp. JJ36]MCF6524526.1 class F sortase [Streptomyces sp. JJ36]
MKAVPRRLAVWVLAALATAALVGSLLTALGGSGGDPPPDFGRPPAATGPAPAPPPSTETGAEAGPAGAQAAPPPVRLRVPEVSLDASVVPVGVADDGTVRVPAEPRQAGWYRFGPAPGAERGSAVLVGHVDSRTGELGALAALYEVRPGDGVRVARDGGPELRYTVTARATVEKDALPAAVFRRAGPPVLTLVTCAPPYDPERGGYQRNLVVTAEPAG